MRLRTITIVALVLLLLVVAGCGGSHKSTAPLALQARLTYKAKTPTVKINLIVGVTAVGGGDVRMDTNPGREDASTQLYDAARHTALDTGGSLVSDNWPPFTIAYDPPVFVGLPLAESWGLAAAAAEQFASVGAHTVTYEGRAAIAGSLPVSGSLRTQIIVDRATLFPLSLAGPMISLNTNKVGGSYTLQFDELHIGRLSLDGAFALATPSSGLAHVGPMVRLGTLAQVERTAGFAPFLPTTLPAGAHLSVLGTTAVGNGPCEWWTPSAGPGRATAPREISAAYTRDFAGFTVATSRVVGRPEGMLYGKPITRLFGYRRIVLQAGPFAGRSAATWLYGDQGPGLLVRDARHQVIICGALTRTQLVQLAESLRPASAPVPSLTTGKATGPSGFTVPTKTFSSAALGVSFRYPASWRAVLVQRQTLNRATLVTRELRGTSGHVDVLVWLIGGLRGKTPLDYRDATARDLAVVRGDTTDEPKQIGYQLAYFGGLCFAEAELLSERDGGLNRVVALCSAGYGLSFGALHESVLSIEVGCPARQWPAQRATLMAILASMRFARPQG
jgi:hypothetical protein